jgi:hypothetical protein
MKKNLKIKKTVKSFTVHSETLMPKRHKKSYSDFSKYFRVFYNKKREKRK